MTSSYLELNAYFCQTTHKYLLTFQCLGVQNVGRDKSTNVKCILKETLCSANLFHLKGTFGSFLRNSCFYIVLSI